MMQTLWSRIAQVRNAGTACRCPQCLSVSGVTQRAGATATNRAPKYLTSSTLWYSGIFAAAATLDAGLKQQRREKWDRAIADVRQELGQETGAHSENVRTEATPEAAVAQDGDTVLWTPNMDLFSEVEPTYKRPHWPTNTGTTLQVHNLAPESIYASQERRARGEARGWSAKKVETISISIDMLQLQIFLSLQARGFAEEAAESVPQEYGDKMLDVGRIENAIGALRQNLRGVWASDNTLERYERAPSPDLLLNGFGHAFDDRPPENRSYRIPRDLNLSLQQLFTEHRRKRISTPSLLAWIGYSLSISTSPPSLDTFNTLLLGLSAANETDVVYHVIRSLRRCHLRPNEVSNRAILDHYTNANDATGFVRWVELMRGKRSGLALARSDIRVTAACAGRLVEKQGDPGKIIQLPYPTPDVFASLIAGVMKFGGFDTALNVCKNMGDNGWGLSMSGLGPLLEDCVDRKDWQAGLGVWEQIKLLEAKSSRQAGSDRVKERIPMQIFAFMLRLCLGEGERDVYDEVWQHATKSHKHNFAALRRLVKDQLGIPSRRRVSARRASADADFLNTNDLDNLNLGNADDATGLLSEDYDIGNDAHASQSIESRTSAKERDPESSIRHEGDIPPRSRNSGLATQQQELTLEHFYGSMAGPQELDEYENVERPMTMRR